MKKFWGMIIFVVSGEGVAPLILTIFVFFIVSFSGKCTDYLYILLIKHVLHLFVSGNQNNGFQ